MKAIYKTLTRWEAVDGKIFESEDACGAHEAQMSPEQRYAYAHRLTKEQLAEEGLWEYGYITSRTVEEYEEPAFLRQGGYYERTETDFVSLGFAQGRLDQVLMLAGKNLQWARASQPSVTKRPLTMVG